MRMLSLRREHIAPLALAGALAAGLGISGCGLNDVDVPEFDGPSELALSLKLQVTPDIITADGFSTALITATLRNESSRPVAGRSIFFTITDEDGRIADLGNFQGSNGPGTGVTLVTNAQGIAQVIYEAPPRTDATANQLVLIAARPIGDDAFGALYRAVALELRSAEPRLFPQRPGNGLPSCPFVVEAPNGLRANVAVLFQTAASDTDGVIVRYEWFFGDGSQVEYAPDLAHVFRHAGAFTVTHRVTDDDGGQAACATNLPIAP